MLPVLLSSVLGVALAASEPAVTVPKQPVPDPAELLATVNGTEIRRRDVELVYKIDEARRARSAVGISPAAVPMKKKGIMLQLIQIELLYQEAGRRGFSVGERELDQVVASLKGKGPYTALPVGALPIMTEADIVAMARRTIMLGRFRAAIAAEIEVTNKDAEKFFARNKAVYLTKEEVDLRQILIRIKAPEDVDAARKKAEMVRAAVEAGEDFAELARKHSDDPSAVRGGEIGTYQWGTIANVVFKTPVGEVTEPMRTPSGFHLIKVEAHRQPRQPEFDEVRHRVIADLERKQTDREMAMLGERLRMEGKVWYKDTWDTDMPRTPRLR